MGETRTPTDFWAGLGFSRSMPEAAIRQRLTNHGARFHAGLGRMETTFEASWMEGLGEGHSVKIHKICKNCWFT